MLISDMKRIVDQISKDKGIDFDTLISTLEEALASAARKKLGSNIDIEVQYNEKLNDIEVFQFMEVVETVEEPEFQITLREGRKLDPDCEIGDSLGTKVDTSTFGRIAAQSAKQVIIQRMKDAERTAIYDNFIDRENEIINGIVQRIDRNDIIVNLGQADAVLPVREQFPNESYRRGDRIRALILRVMEASRGPQIVLSRTHPNFIINLFKTEVPEISEGLVEIKGAAREPGSRAKIAVSSKDADIDPVGACVGMKGSRVQNVVQELRGEKIDIIPWNLDAAKYVCNALAPAEISKVIIDEENRAMEVIVHDDFLSVAIGKRGQNVRLASKLTGWHLDVKSEEKYSTQVKNVLDSLMSINQISPVAATKLFESGYSSIHDIASVSVTQLSQLLDINEETAEVILSAASKASEKEKAKDGVVEDEVTEDEVAEDEVAEDEVAEDEEAEDEEAEDEEAEDEEAEDEETEDEETEDEETEDEDEEE